MESGRLAGLRRLFFLRLVADGSRVQNRIMSGWGQGAAAAFRMESLEGPHRLQKRPQFVSSAAVSNAPEAALYTKHH